VTVVLGRPVSGTITKPAGHTAEQWPGTQFLPLLDAVLNQPGVAAVRWTQYTPYFNDGDPCIFGVNDFTVKLTDGDPDAGDYGDGYLNEWDMRDRGTGGWATGYANLAPALRSLEEVSEHFEEFLKESFGDHATVTATRAGFEIEFYDHD
jgi:hypothetical protein